jgi:hypothetical protein
MTNMQGNLQAEVDRNSNGRSFDRTVSGWNLSAGLEGSEPPCGQAILTVILRGERRARRVHDNSLSVRSLRSVERKTANLMPQSNARTCHEL